MAVLSPQDRAQLEDALRAYDLGPLETFAPVERGTVNTSYAFVAGGVRHFFRLYEEQDLEGARAEARLLFHLRAHGAKTPAPLARRDGELAGLHAGKPFAVFPFVAGDMRCQAAVTARDAGKLGAEVARLHIAARGADLKPSRFGARELGARLDAIRLHAPRELAELVPLLTAHLSRVEAQRARITRPPGIMIHGDLFRDNVLFDGDEIASVLDFESAGEGHPTYDLAVALLAFSFRDAFDWDVARALVLGYEHVLGLHSVPREALFWDACFGAVRFSITRITDSAMRGGRKDYRRFLSRLAALDALGPLRFEEKLA